MAKTHKKKKSHKKRCSCSKCASVSQRVTVGSTAPAPITYATYAPSPPGPTHFVTELGAGFPTERPNNTSHSSASSRVSNRDDQQYGPFHGHGVTGKPKTPSVSQMDTDMSSPFERWRWQQANAPSPPSSEMSVSSVKKSEKSEKSEKSSSLTPSKVDRAFAHLKAEAAMHPLKPSPRRPRAAGAMRDRPSASDALLGRLARAHAEAARKPPSEGSQSGFSAGTPLIV